MFRKVIPDPYLLMTADNDKSLRISPWSKEHLEFELRFAAGGLGAPRKPVSFIVQLADVKQLAVEGERLVQERLQNLDRERYGVALVLVK